MVLLCLALALASCGGGGSSTTGTASTAASNDAGTGEEVRSAAPSDKGQQGGRPAARDGARDDGVQIASSGPADATACQARIGNFVDRMSDLRQSLLAGLSYAEYVVRVKAIRDAYEAVPVDRLGVDCLSGPAAEAEDAFNQYLRAANVWGECAGTAGCAAGEIEGRLQHRWQIASKSLDAAKRG